MPKIFSNFSLTRLGRAGLNLLFPAQCPGCNKLVEEERVLCPSCWQRISWLQPPFCPACGEPEHACGGHAKPGPLHGVWAWAWHEGLLAELIGRFKYDKQYSLGFALARLMRHNPLGWEQEDFDWLVPVPLHARRIKARGFNQAVLLGRGLEKFKEKLNINMLQREQERPPQVGLGRTRRQDNVKGIFSVMPGARPQNMRILLLDDVWTTGATMRECARTLLAAGASRVGALTLSRAPLEKDGPSLP